MENVRRITREDVADVRLLRAQLDGTVVEPGDEGWDEARQAWNLAVDQQPELVVLAESALDVAAVVDYAAARGLRVAAQGTGHNAVALGPLDGTVLVKTSRMRAVTIDPDARIARAEAGAVWLDVVEAAAPHGLASLAGSSPDVGVVGYTLGGGLSWLGRKHGLAANNVTAIELVTAAGDLVRATREDDPDLVWALRGGGGAFGVVTAIEFRLFPLEEVYAGVLWFPFERAAEVLHAWRDYVEAGVPDELTTVGRLLRLPPLPEIPEPVRGKSFVIVEAIYLGDEAEGAKLLEPLRALGPAMDTVATIPVAALAHLHMDPEEPVPGAGDGDLLAELTPEAIDALVAAAGPGTDRQLVSVELRHLGGAIGRPAPEHGAISAFDAEFAFFAVGFAPTPELQARAEADAQALLAVLEPWKARQTYMNFVERREDARRFVSEAAYRRLRRIKARVDPADMIRSNHPLEPYEVSCD
jgi:FAD/FMN-containing dehydrogenase